MSDDRPPEVGKLFNDDEVGTARRYWFVAGLSLGLLAAGLAGYYGDCRPLLLLLVGGSTALALARYRDYGGWDV